jgi:hypothetical protein
MSNPEINLTGVWQSQHKYGRREVTEHTLDLRQRALMIEGSSRLPGSSSELFLHLLLRDQAVIEGKWDEVIRARGENGGRRFRGMLALMLNSKHDKATGIWLSPLNHKKISSGPWTMERIE